MEDWQDRLKSMDQDFVVVDKPPVMPCFPKVSNGRESLSKCLREALQVRKWGGGEQDKIDDKLNPCHEIDDEASGLIVLARHDKAEEIFEEWLEEQKVVFEFVALTNGIPEKGIYRHYYRIVEEKDPGQRKPELFEDIPPVFINGRKDYDDWDVVQMEVVATAPLQNGCAAVRVRTHATGWNERVRTQLAMIGTPILNDKEAEGVKVSKERRTSNLLSDSGEPSSSSGSRRSSAAADEDDEEEEEEAVPRTAAAARLRKGMNRSSMAFAPLGGAIDGETLRGPYGRKLRLLPGAREGANQGVSQKYRQKVPIALHLARVEFGAETTKRI